MGPTSLEEKLQQAIARQLEIICEVQSSNDAKAECSRELAEHSQTFLNLVSAVSIMNEDKRSNEMATEEEFRRGIVKLAREHFKSDRDK